MKSKHLWKYCSAVSRQKFMNIFVTLKTNAKRYNMYEVRMKMQETILGWNEEKSWYRRNCEESKSHNFLSRFSKAEFLTRASRQHVASLAEVIQGIAIRRKTILKTTFNSSVQFSRSVVSDTLQPHEPQHTRSPCPSPTPEVHPNPCPSSWWCHPTISSSVIPFSSCP